jgi:hypothetical protein
MSHFTYLLALGLAAVASSAVFGQTEESATSEIPYKKGLEGSNCGESGEPMSGGAQLRDLEYLYSAYDVAKMPSFPGGEQAMLRYISDNYRIPARADCAHGTIVISAVVEKDSSLSNLKILKEPVVGMGLEGIRVLESMPCWIPGQNGVEHPVRTLITLPIRIRVE